MSRRARIAGAVVLIAAGVTTGLILTRPTTDVLPERLCPEGLSQVALVSSGLPLCSHGPDPVGYVGANGICLFGICPVNPVSPPPPPAYPCVGDGTSGERIRVYYVHQPGNARNNWLQLTRNAAAQADAYLFERTGQHYRYLCANGLINVTPLAVSSGSLDAFRRAVGEARADRFYAAYNEQPPGAGFGGMATGQPDTGPDPLRHRGPQYSTTIAFAHTVYVHELGHNLGAVQNTAPHSTGAGHCNDEIDVMCYRDGGPRNQTMRQVCPNPERYDCTRDDYWNPNPPPGSYLARNWNTFRSLFLTTRGG